MLGSTLMLALALLMAVIQPAAAQASDTQDASRRLVQLGAGDSVTIQVYGQPDMTTTALVADDGTIAVPLAGPVQVTGLSPAEAADRIEKALRDGNFLIDPNVTLNVMQSRSQRVSVLGEVNTPGRYQIESNTPIYDLLAQAGGTTENASDVVFVLRPDKDGVVQRYPVDLRGLSHNTLSSLPTQTLQGGDSVFVPKAELFYIYGEVRTPNSYKVEQNMTVEQALVRAGGISERGSKRRIELKRTDASGKSITKGAKLSDPVLPNDVITVKEAIF
jgi:polysaccharide export outer membrane protein